MKMALTWIVAAILGLAPAVDAVRQTMAREAAVRAGGQAVMEHRAAASAQSGSKAEVAAMLSQMMRDRKPKGGMDLHKVMRAATSKITMDEAVHNLEHDLPPDVASLVRLAKKSNSHSSSKGEQTPPFDEASIQKARGILNGMIESAWLELDDVVFELKEFEERNRGTYEQVVTDLARLGSQLADLNTKRLTATAASQSYVDQRIEVDGQFHTAETSYNTINAANQMELTRRKNDLAVFDFILNLTRCKEGQKFLQMPGSTSHLQKGKGGLLVCSTESGGIAFDFQNKKMQNKVERMMTPAAKLALRAALGQTAAPLSLLQEDSRESNSTSVVVIPPAPVMEEPHPSGQWKKCVDGEENCGLLHDLMSLEWGKFRDEVDELTSEMDSNKAAWDSEEANFNQQYSVISDAKAKYDEMLADAISAISTDTEESNEKEEQRLDLEREYHREMGKFMAIIMEILHTKICAVRKVRNGILSFSTTSPPSKVDDCDVSDWFSKTGQCMKTGNVITCDDSCPRPNPFACGGTEVMKRDIVVIPNQYGIVCPPLERTKKCGQKKCEVDCGLSIWSEWSSCSKDCGGGVQVRTRSVLVKPMNGGVSCDAPQEDRPCHTFTCDRNCQLADWSDWDFCSMACGGGVTERKKSVIIPTRGQGTCPGKNNVQRKEDKECNEQDCTGDEICIAKQDLIIALDSSGSLKQTGFEILQTFAANITKRYQADYFASDAVKIGVVVFGNGHLIDQNGVTTTSSAIKLQPLTTDFAAVRTAIKGVKWQRGFTNMAQAFSEADTLLSQGGREYAQSAVLVISDGKYSMRFQTMEKARELKDKNVKVLMAAVTTVSGEDLLPIKQIASRPFNTNFLKIPGLGALKENNAMFVEQVVTTFCPDATSPSLMVQQDVQRDYMLIKEEGEPNFACGQIPHCEPDFEHPDECAEYAREGANEMVFTYGHGEEEGVCCMYQLTVQVADWDNFLADRTNPRCPDAQKKAESGWQVNPFMDTYVLNPSSTGFTLGPEP